VEIWYASHAGWSVYLLGWLFLVYGFLGVVIETVYCFARERVLECRFGLVYLPIRPMYGIGGVACTVLLDRFQPQPVVVLLGGLVICTAIEYVAGSVCDRLFGTLSWDYRSKLLHLHGKVCLQYSCYWAILAALTVYVVTPVISGSVHRMDATVGATVLTVLIALTLSCVVLTVAAWVRTRRRLDAQQAQPDGFPLTIPGSVAGRLVDLLVPDPLMINTFPRTRLTRELSALTGHQRVLVSLARDRQSSSGSSYADGSSIASDSSGTTTIFDSNPCSARR
jgi:uncharacterized membrane protein